MVVVGFGAKDVGLSTVWLSCNTFPSELIEYCLYSEA